MGTQYDHVKAILEGSRQALAIHDISKAIWQRFRVRHADTAISARIRELRHDLAVKGKTIVSHRAAPDKCHHVYAISKLAG